MRARLGILILALAATLISPIQPVAVAFGGLASAPLNVTSTAVSGGLRVTWQTPSDVDTGITGYRIEHSTSGTAGNWSLSGTTNSSTFTFDVLGLSQTATYVRVAATTTAGIGTYGYPWTKLYGTTQRQRNGDDSIGYELGFGTAVGDPFNTLQSASFTRVRYLLNTTLTSGGTQQYADVDFYKWANPGDTTQTTNATAIATIQNLSIPTNSVYTHIVQANVSDLNVFSDHPSVTDGRGLNGRLEIWGRDYTWGLSGLTPAGSSGNYDYDDTPVAGSYGSFQVHNISNLQTVFAWNRHQFAQVSDLNYGTNTTSSANPDSTFCYMGGTYGTCPSYSAFRLQIYANIPVTPLADATPPTVSRIDSRLLGKNGDTITVRSTEVGTVYLVNQSVTVTNLASITGAASANRNSVSISAANTNTTLTLASLNSGLYNLYAADSANNLSTAVLATIRVDNDLPTATTIEVNSSGTAIILIASETITNSLQLGGIYTISDSSSAVSVSSTSFSANVATLNLARVIPAGSTVNFAYSPLGGAAGGRWIDQAGNEMAAISTRTITNNSAAAITVTLTVPASISKGTSISISALVSVAGRVTFTIGGKRIPACFNRAATGSTPITISCNFKPALTGQQTIRAVLVPTIGAYPTTITSVERFIFKRSASR